jgi:SAM-dependent methyltransferase
VLKNAGIRAIKCDFENMIAHQQDSQMTQEPTISNTPLSDIVSSQYTKWIYPEPIIDLPGWLANNWQWFDPSHAHRLFWPDRDYQPGLDILIAGCGTNQAAVIAFTNPGAHIVAVDVSQQSLAHQQFLKDKYGLENLELHQLPIEVINTLGRDFDLIISTGVLHHMASPETGMKALAGCLRQDGVAAIMLYAKYGRIGVDMMQSVFRDMGLDQSETSVEMVKKVLATLPADHPIRSYMAIAPDLGFDAGLVDTFLHGRERNYSVKDCLDLVASADLVFQDLFFKAPYHPPMLSTDSVNAALSKLPKERQWSIMEQTNFRNGCHFFTACRKDRPTTSYKIDFAGERVFDHIPSWRYQCKLSGDTLSRNDWSMTLDLAQLALMQQVDGKRCIRDIASLLAPAKLFQQLQPSEFENYIKKQFQAFWQLDFLAMGLPRTGLA